MKYQICIQKKLLLPALVSCFLSPAALMIAETLRLEVSEDTTVARPGNDDHNLGGWDGLQVGNTNERLSVIRFDTSTLSALEGKTVTAVKLMMTSRRFVGDNTYTFDYPQNIEIRQLVAENKFWVEGNGQWEPGIEGATYNNQVHDIVPWASNTPITYQEMDNFLNTAFSINLEGVTVVHDEPFEFDIDPALIEGWLLDVDLAQAGIALISSSVTNSEEVMGFYSKEAEEALFRPYMLIEYEEDSDPDIWAGFDVVNGWVETDFSGLLYVGHRPWVFSYDLQNWMMLPESNVSEDGAWAYVIRM